MAASQAPHLRVIAGQADHAPTDLGNAELFAALHTHRLRYVAERGHWIFFQDGRWRRDATGEAERAAKDTARTRLEQAGGIADDTERAKAAKWAATSQAEPRLRALLKLAETEPEIVVADHQLDHDPMLLTCGTGTLDLTTGTLRPHDPADLITHGTTVPWNPTASCPRWQRFLTEIFGDDAELIGFLQRFVGYALTGETREHVLAVFYGTGANGKSVLAEILKHLLGDLAITAAFDTFSRARGDRGARNDLARLRGARLVTASEGSDGRRLDEATVKEITGGDMITARFLHQEFFEYKPGFKLVLITNFKPRVDGDDDAIWRRLRLVPFEQSFRGREDHTLVHALHAELPGILAWAVKGCLAWQADGLGSAAAVTAATTAYRGEEDTLGQFLAEHCQLQGEITVAALRAAYETHCTENGERPLSGSALGKRLARRGITSERRAQGRRVYIGLSLIGGNR